MTPAPPTTEQRLATLEVRVAAIETKLLAPRKAPTDERAADCWTRIEDCLKRYVDSSKFQGHEGCWVFGRFLILLVLAGLAACGFYYLPIFLPIFFALLGAGEILLYNTAVVFVTKGIGSRLRSVVLTIVGFASLAVAFAPLWIMLRFTETDRVPARLAAGIYQSVRTLTTAGPESSPSSSQCPVAMQWIASVEMIIGIYFVAVILAGYISVATKKGDGNGPTR